MTDAPAASRTVVVECALPHPPEKVWRALTQPALIAEWLMQNDFAPVADHRFTLRADWGTVECRVLEVVPQRSLSYAWVAYGVKTVVTWTLTPVAEGTHLRMEQSGFRPDQQQAFAGAQGGWPRFFAALEQVLARMG